MVHCHPARRWLWLFDNKSTALMRGPLSLPVLKDGASRGEKVKLPALAHRASSPGGSASALAPLFNILLNVRPLYFGLSVGLRVSLVAARAFRFES